MATGVPTLRRKRLGKLMRQTREASDVTAPKAAEALDCSVSKIYRFETGHHALRLVDLRVLLDLYGVADEQRRDELETLVKEGKQRGWWTRYGSVVAPPYATYLDFESEARRLMLYEALVVHGLLQTEEYATALFAGNARRDDEETLKRRVQIRMDRQQILHQDDPLDLRVVIDESVLARRIGGPGSDILTRQLDHLLECARMPNVTIQVLPLAEGAHPGMLSAFTIMQFRHTVDPDVVYIEGLAGDVYEEDEAEVEMYKLVYDDLRAAALSPDKSIKLMRQARDRAAPD